MESSKAALRWANWKGIGITIPSQAAARLEGGMKVNEHIHKGTYGEVYLSTNERPHGHASSLACTNLSHRLFASPDGERNNSSPKRNAKKAHRISLA